MGLGRLFSSPWHRSPLTRAEVRLRGLLILFGGPAFAALAAGCGHLAVWLIGEWFGQEGTVIGVGLLLVAAGFAVLSAAAGLAELVTGVEAGEWAVRWESLPAWVRLLIAYGSVIGLGGGLILYAYSRLP
jgi:hypothetical protein